MRQWYFDYNSKRYWSGQVILIEGPYDPILKKSVPQEAVFVFCETNSGRYVYKKLCNGSGEKWCTGKMFFNIFLGVVEGKTASEYVQQEYNQWYQQHRKLTLLEEIDQIEGMLGAWIMYIAAMLAFLVCKEWYIGWLLASVIFWGYRYSKLEERKEK